MKKKRHENESLIPSAVGVISVDGWWLLFAAGSDDVMNICTALRTSRTSQLFLGFTHLYYPLRNVFLPKHSYCEGRFRCGIRW